MASKVNDSFLTKSQSRRDSDSRDSRKCRILETARDFASHQPAPAWLEIRPRELQGPRQSPLPKREDIQLPVNEQLIVDYIEVEFLPKVQSFRVSGFQNLEPCNLKL